MPLDKNIRHIEAVLEAVGDDRRLAVDANGRFDLQAGIAYAEAIKKHNLFRYEETGNPRDYALQAELANHHELPMTWWWEHPHPQLIVRLIAMVDALPYSPQIIAIIVRYYGPIVLTIDNSGWLTSLST